MFKFTLSLRSIALSLCLAFMCLILTKTAAQNCQTIVGTIETTPAVTDSVLKICLGTKVEFRGRGTYPQNGLRYAQSDSLSTFTWHISNNILRGKNLNFTFHTGGVYPITLIIRDTAGCEGTQKYKVYVSAAPDFYIKPVIFLKIGDTFRFIVKPEIKDTSAAISYTHKWLKPLPSVLVDTAVRFIPDNPGQESVIPIKIAGFENGRVLTSNDPLLVKINMEHSWARDLNINLTCPSGKIVTLHKYDEGG